MGQTGAEEPDSGRAAGGTDGASNDTPATRLWGGRFGAGLADALARLSVSVQFDWRLARYDLRASRAHARVLHRAGLLTDAELSSMLKALEDLDRACANGSFRPTVADEDVHTALERGLLERLGALGGKLRAGRSRNDQVATDLRLYLRDNVRLIVSRLAELETALIDQAAASGDLPAPGMTHLQHAQPVLFGHQLLAHVQAFARDVGRLRDWDKRAAVSPLGSGALAGSSLPVDPQVLAAELGFDEPAPELHGRGGRPRLRGRVLLRRGADRGAPVPARRGDRALVLAGVRLGGDRRRLRDRVLDHAAEEEPGRGRAGPGQGGPPDRRPDRAAHHAQGAAADLQPGPAGGQGAGLQRGRHPAPGAARHGRPDRDDAGQSRPAAPRRLDRVHPAPPTWPSTWSAGASRSARRTRSSGTWWCGARSTTATWPT